MSAEKINLIVTKDAIADIQNAIDKVKELSTTIGSVKTVSGSNAFTESVKKQAEQVSKLTVVWKEQFDLENRLISNKKKIELATESTNRKVKEQEALLKQLNTQVRLEAIANSNLINAYTRLNAQRDIAKNRLRDLMSAESKNTAEINKAQKAFDLLDQKVRKADRAVGDMSKNVGNYKSAFSGLSNLMGAFGIGTGLYLAVDIAKNIYETTKQLQSLDLALKMVSETELEFAKNQQFVTEVADKWGLEIKSLQQTYTQFYTASKGLLTDNQIKETFEGIAKAGSVMGLSLDTQKNAFYAIDQMMSKGTVTSEELKKQLGNAMPGAIKAAAMAYMELHPQIKSIQEAEKALYEDMKKGAIDSATYVPLIAKNFQILYGIESLNSVHTMQAAQNRLVNSWTEWIRGTTQGGSGLKIIVSLMEALAKNLGTVINILALSATGWLAYKSAILLASLQTKLLTLTTTQAVVATETQTVVTGFQTAAQIANTTATTAATTAWQRFTLALKANALGLAILAIGAAVVIFNHFNKSIEETTSEIKEANNAFITNREIVTKTVIENDKLIDRYEKLSKKIKDVGSFTKLSKEEQLEYNGILADLSKKVPNAITVVDNYGVAISLSTKILKKYNYELKKQLEYKRTIALAKDKELIPELKDDIAKKQEWLDFSLSFQKNGATHEGTKTMEVSVAEQRLALSIAKNELTMAEARIKSMQEQIKAESEEVKNDEVKNKTKERTIELIDKEIEALKKTEPNIKSRKEGLEYQKELNRLQKERAYILGEEEKINTKAHKKESKDKEQHLKDLYDLRMAQLEKDKLILEQGLENEKLTYSEKLDIAFDISIKEMEIAKAKYDEETRLAQKNKTESQKLNKEQNEQEKIADINFWKEKEKLAKDAIKRINDIKYKPQYARQELADPEKYGEGVEIMSEEQIEGDVEEWNKLQDKKKQAHEEDKQRLKDQIKLFNEFAGDFANKSGFSQTFDNFLKEDKKGVSLMDTLFDDKKVMDKEAKMKATFLAISSAAQDMFNLIAESSQRNFDAEYARLEKQKEVSLRFAGDSDAAKKKIEEDYEKRRKQIAVREFKAKQKIAMVNIAIDTAQAIMATLGKGGFFASPLAMVVAAMGAIQLAMVATQKVPEFWRGTKNAPEGVAWTNEKGAELHTDRHGNIKDFGTNKGATLTKMDAGDIVYTAEETRRMMFENEYNGLLAKNGITGAKVEVKNGMTAVEMDEVLSKHFSQIQTNTTVIDRNGLSQWSERNGNRTIEHSNRVSRTGFRV